MNRIAALSLCVCMLVFGGCKSSSKEHESKRERDRNMMRLNDAERQRDDARAQVQQSKTQLDEANARLQAAQKETTDAQSQMRDAQQRMAKSQAEHDALINLQTELETLRAQNAKLTSDLDALNKRMSESSHAPPAAATRPAEMNK